MNDATALPMPDRRSVQQITEDPLDPDLLSDAMLPVTRRQICRVATVAAEAGARFQREGQAVDPMGWMLAPRMMFHGAAALEACMQLEHFVNATLLHGLSLGLDADPRLFATLLRDGEPLIPDVEIQPKTRKRKVYQNRARKTGRPSSQLRARSNAVAVRTMKRDMTGTLNPAS
ncbi:MAG: hypothetical protein ABIV36_00980 [Sphingobium limneticum]